MDIGQSTLTIIASVLMIAGLLLSVLPFLPGPLILWVISLGYGILTGFERLTPLSMVVITILMLVATTKDIWMPIIGMKAYGVSCSSALGMIVGGLVGTFAIPIPLIGTLLGAIGGAVLLELLNMGEMQKALRAGGVAFKAFILGMITELGFNVLIAGVFFASIFAGR